MYSLDLREKTVTERGADCMHSTVAEKPALAKLSCGGLASKLLLLTTLSLFTLVLCSFNYFRLQMFSREEFLAHSCEYCSGRDEFEYGTPRVGSVPQIEYRPDQPVVENSCFWMQITIDLFLYFFPTLESREATAYLWPDGTFRIRSDRGWERYEVFIEGHTRNVARLLDRIMILISTQINHNIQKTPVMRASRLYFREIRHHPQHLKRFDNGLASVLLDTRTVLQVALYGQERY